MEIERAKEIAASPVMSKVTYNGTPIYMERVNEKEQTCTVHYLKKTDKNLDVPLQQLVEH